MPKELKVLTQDVGLKILDVLFKATGPLTAQEIADRVGVKDAGKLEADLYLLMDGGLGGTKLRLAMGFDKSGKGPQKFELMDYADRWEAARLAGTRGLTLDELHHLLEPVKAGVKMVEKPSDPRIGKPVMESKQLYDKPSRKDLVTEVNIYNKAGVIVLNQQGRYVWTELFADGADKAEVAPVDDALVAGGAGWARVRAVLPVGPPGATLDAILDALSKAGVKRTTTWLRQELTQATKKGLVKTTGQAWRREDPQRYYVEN